VRESINQFYFVVCTLFTTVPLTYARTYLYLEWLFIFTIIAIRI